MDPCESQLQGSHTVDDNLEQVSVGINCSSINTQKEILKIV